MYMDFSNLENTMEPAQQRTIASFDIGIKNMAYCVALVDIATKTITRIHKWGIINMVDAPHPLVDAGPPICCYSAASIKSNLAGKCGNRAAFTRAGAMYCKKHLSAACGGAGALVRTISARDYSAIKKKTVEQLREFVAANGLPAAIMEGKKAKIVENIYREIDRDFFLPVATATATAVPKEAGGAKESGGSTGTACTSAKEIDLISVGRTMKTRLDEIFCGGAPPLPPLHVDDVFIENQIGTLATRMRTIQGMLTQYFIFVAPHAQIKYVSASLKLKGRIDKKSTYKERKAASIEITQRLLEESAHESVKSWLPFFRGYGAKKDDLADSFLQICGAL